MDRKETVASSILQFTNLDEAPGIRLGWVEGQRIFKALDCRLHFRLKNCQTLTQNALLSPTHTILPTLCNSIHYCRLFIDCTVARRRKIVACIMTKEGLSGLSTVSSLQKLGEIYSATPTGQRFRLLQNDPRQH